MHVWYLPDLPQNEGICMNITSKKREYKLVEFNATIHEFMLHLY